MLIQRTLSANVQDGALRPKRSRNTRHCVSATRPSRRYDTAQPTRLACISVGRMRSNLFMTHINDANTFVNTTVINVDNMSATKSKDGIHTLGFQRLGNQAPSGNEVCRFTLLCQGVLCGIRSYLVLCASHYFLLPSLAGLSHFNLV